VSLGASVGEPFFRGASAVARPAERSGSELEVGLIRVVPSRLRVGRRPLYNRSLRTPTDRVSGTAVNGVLSAARWRSACGLAPPCGPGCRERRRRRLRPGGLPSLTLFFAGGLPAVARNRRAFVKELQCAELRGRPQPPGLRKKSCRSPPSPRAPQIPPAIRPEGPPKAGPRRAPGPSRHPTEPPPDRAARPSRPPSRR